MVGESSGVGIVKLVSGILSLENVCSSVVELPEAVDMVTQPRRIKMAMK